jgi:hypothetical protein
MFYLKEQGGAVPALQDIFTDPEKRRNVYEMDLSKGKLPPPPRGKEYAQLTYTSSFDLNRAIEQLNQDLFYYGFPEILGPTGGEAEAGAGYATSLRQNASNRYISPLLQNYAQGWQEIFLMVGEAQKKLRVPIKLRTVEQAEGKGRETMREVTVKPDDWVDIDMRVTFSTKDASVEYAERESDLRLLQAGLMSELTFMSRHYEDPLREMKQRDIDQAAKQGAADALADFQQWQQERRGLFEEVAGEFADQAPAVVGGRNERPPEGSAGPGLGATLSQPTPPVPLGGEQVPGAPQGMATGSTGGAV